MSFMDVTDRTKFRRKYIHPLLKAGILEQTVPDKPNSRNQKYQLTAIGLELINVIDNHS
jgi:ATP-dependent DNA helicase RecG